MPSGIRRALGIRPGGKVRFTRKGHGVLVDDPAIVLIAVLDVRTDRQDDATTAAVTRGLLDAYRAEQDRRAATLKATRDDLAARSAALTVTDLRAARRLVKS